MKLMTLILTLGTLTSTFSFAQNIMQISGSGPLMLNCNFSKGYAPSAKMAEITKSKQSVAHCTDSDQVFEVAYFNMKIQADDGFANKVINLRCTGESASGIYLFGGYPVGFQTQSSSRAPWFYKVQDEERSGNGRCSLEYDSNFITGIEAVQNKSMMVFT